MSVLDERAQQACSAVEQAVAEVDPGEFKPARPVGPFLLVMATLVVLGVVGGWLVLASIGPDLVAGEAEDEAPAGEGQPAIDMSEMIMVLGEPPAGFTAEASVTDWGGDETVRIYGRRGTGDPFAEGDLAVASWPFDQNRDRLAPEGAERREIEGTTVFRQREANVAFWVDDTGNEYWVQSHQFDGDQVYAVAESIIVDSVIDRQGLDLLYEGRSFDWKPQATTEYADSERRISLRVTTVLTPDDTYAAWKDLSEPFEPAPGPGQQAGQPEPDIVILGGYEARVDVVNERFFFASFDIDDRTGVSLTVTGISIDEFVPMAETLRWAEPDEVPALLKAGQRSAGAASDRPED